MTAYGPTRTPGAQLGPGMRPPPSGGSSAVRSPTAVGPLARPAGLQRVDAALEGAHVAQQVREPRDGGQRAPASRRPASAGVPIISRRPATSPMARRPGRRSAAPSPTVTWSATPTCPASTTPRADAAGARDARLGDDDRVRADHGIMADLHEVVDLRPAADHGLAERRAVDGGVGADLHVVLDDDPAHLGDLAVRLAVEHVAEAVGAEHAPGWTITRRPTTHVAPAAPRAGGGRSPRPTRQSGPDERRAGAGRRRASTIDRSGPPRRRPAPWRRATTRALSATYAVGWTPGAGGGLREEHAEDRGDRRVRLRHADRRPAGQVEPGRRDQRRGRAPRGRRPGGGRRRRRTGRRAPRSRDWRNPRITSAGSPSRSPADERAPARRRDARVGIAYFFSFAFSWSYSLMISSVTSASGSP